MPRPKSGPRLQLKRTPSCQQVYIIRDGEKRVSLGIYRGDDQSAQEALAAYIVQKWQARPPRDHVQKKSSMRVSRIGLTSRPRERR